MKIIKQIDFVVYCLSYSYVMFSVVGYVLRRDTCHTLYLLLLSLLLDFVRVGSLYESTRVKESMLCERIMGSAWEW